MRKALTRLRAAALAAGAVVSISLGTGCVEEEGAESAPVLDTSAGGEEENVEHGDHEPRHGGMVYMYGALHFEVVLRRDGRHQVYFSDAMRAELPAGVARGVALTIGRPGEPDEPLEAAIDESGESWIARGAPVLAAEATVRVSFATDGSAYWIDVPFVPAQP